MEQNTEHTSTLNMHFEALPLRGKKCRYMQWGSCESMAFFLCPIFSIFNVIRPPLNLDQEHLSTVEGVFSLATAAT